MRNLIVGHCGTPTADAFGTATLIFVAILTAALGAALLAAAIPPEGAPGVAEIDSALRDLGVFTRPVIGLFTA